MSEEKFWELIDRQAKLVKSRQVAMEGKETQELAILRARERTIRDILNADVGRPELMDAHKEIVAKIVSIEDAILGEGFCNEYYRENSAIQRGWDEYLGIEGKEGGR